MSRRRSLSHMAGLAGAGWLTALAEHLAYGADQNSSHSKTGEKGKGRPKSLLMIWLAGGPSQLETFDPHPGTKIGGDVRAIRTSIPKVEIAESLPATAEQLRLACLVRSVVSKEGDHERATYNLKTGWRPEPTIVHPSIGAILCHQQPSNLEIPRHISILPGRWPARGGYLGPSYDAFQIPDPRQPIPNLTTRVPQPEFEHRVDNLLGTLESEFKRGRLADMDRQRTQHQTATERALAMINSDQRDAFDISQEPSDLKRQFGDTPLGRSCLAAIRLIERGVRCVEVEHAGWDSHISNHEIQTARAQELDGALAATLRELERRDLLDSSIVFCGGEFGRTPTINPAGGRDHWPHGFSVLLAGGNFRRGAVWGETASRLPAAGEEAASLTTQPVTIADLHATMLEALGVDASLELMTPIGRPLKLSEGRVIRELLG